MCLNFGYPFGMYGMGAAGNIPQAMKAKYGNPAAFSGRPYIQECPVAYNDVAVESKRPSCWKRFINKLKG